MQAFFKTFKCTFKKQVSEFKRYPNFMLKSFFYTPITILIPYYFTIKVFVGQNSINNKNVLILLLGSILWNFVYFSVIECLNITTRELNTGTIETLFVTPASKVAWLLGSSFVPSAMFIVTLGTITILMSLFFKIDGNINVFLICFSIIFLIVSTWAMCLFVFVLNIWLKRVFNIVNFLLDILAIFVGILYPISILSKNIRWISYCIPTTYCIQLIRQAFCSKFISIYEIHEMIILAMLSILLFCISIIFFNTFEKRLKQYGNFLKY